MIKRLYFYYTAYLMKYAHACILRCFVSDIHNSFDGLMQERRNSSALAMELRLSCTNTSVWWLFFADSMWIRGIYFAHTYGSVQDMQDCSISSVLLVSNGDTAILH